MEVRRADKPMMEVARGLGVPPVLFSEWHGDSEKHGAEIIGGRRSVRAWCRCCASFRAGHFGCVGSSGIEYTQEESWIGT